MREGPKSRKQKEELNKNETAQQEQLPRKTEWIQSHINETKL